MCRVSKFYSTNHSFSNKRLDKIRKEFLRRCNSCSYLDIVTVRDNHSACEYFLKSYADKRGCSRFTVKVVYCTFKKSVLLTGPRDYSYSHICVTTVCTQRVKSSLEALPIVHFGALDPPPVQRVVLLKLDFDVTGSTPTAIHTGTRLMMSS